MLCSLLKETMTTNSKGSTQASAQIKKIMFKTKLDFFEIRLIAKSSAGSWIGFVGRLIILTLLLEQRAVRFDTADYQIGCHHQNKAHDGLVQTGCRGHAYVAGFFQRPVDIGIDNLGNVI